MTPVDRQKKLKELVKTYGEEKVFEKLQISRRTFELYMKPKVIKMVPIHKLIRIENTLYKERENLRPHL